MTSTFGPDVFLGSSVSQLQAMESTHSGLRTNSSVLGLQAPVHST